MRCPIKRRPVRPAPIGVVAGLTIAYAGCMSSKLPFVGRIFWKTLVVVAVLVVIAWLVILKVTEYEITSADYGGSTICGLIFAYLVHLWILPEETPPSDSEEE